MKRRTFLAGTGAAGALGALGHQASAEEADRAPDRKPCGISLAGWSLHRRHFQEGKLPALDFPKVAREEFDLGAIELVNTMLPCPHANFLRQLGERAREHDVRILLIMVDAEGDLSAAKESARLQAVRNHEKWVEIASVLGCHAIRVNTGGRAGDEAAITRCADSLTRLGAVGMQRGIDIICENHGGLSSHPPSMTKLMQTVDSSHVGTLPDFGNFPGDVDKYEAIASMMPWAKAVSAKCHDFGPDGTETRIDFARMMSIVTDAGYDGHVGIEFEGGRMSEHDGIIAARDLLRSLGHGDANR